MVHGSPVETIFLLACGLAVTCSPLVVMGLQRRSHRAGPGATVSLAQWLVGPLVCSSVAAGVIHLTVVPAHLDEYLPYGLAFGALAAFQVAWSLALIRRPGRSVLLVGLLVNAGVIAVWIASRTSGLPLGPEPGAPEDLGVADAAATVFEALLVIGLAARLLSRVDRALERRRLSFADAQLGMMMFVVAIALVATFAVADFAAGSGGHDHGAATIVPSARSS